MKNCNIVTINPTDTIKYKCEPTSRKEDINICIQNCYCHYLNYEVEMFRLWIPMINSTVFISHWRKRRIGLPQLPLNWQCTGVKHNQRGLSVCQPSIVRRVQGQELTRREMCSTRVLHCLLYQPSSNKHTLGPWSSALWQRQWRVTPFWGLQRRKHVSPHVP